MLLLFQLPEKWETHKEKRERRALDLGRETKSHSMEESYCEKYVYCSQIFDDEDYMLAPLFCSDIFLPFYGQPRTSCGTVLKLHASRLQLLSLVGAYYLHPQTRVPYFYIMINDAMTRAL